MNKSKKFNDLTIKLLHALGNKKPTRKQVELIEKLLFTTLIRQQLLVSEVLTKREVSCLLLAAKGLTSDKIASLLEIKKVTVETHRRNILRKMSCTTLTQALFEAIKFGYIKPKTDLIET